MSSRFKKYDQRIKEILNENSEIKNFEIIDKVQSRTYNRNDSKAFSKYITRFRKRFNEDYQGVFDATDSLDIDNINVKHLWVKNKHDICKKSKLY